MGGLFGVPISAMPAFRYWVVALVVLFVKMWANSSVQGFSRFRSGTFVLPEDAAKFGKTAAAAQDDPLAERASRCWRNDLENIPLFLFLGLAFALMRGNPTWAAVYFTVFVVARMAHTAFMLRPRQPHRALAYNTGVLACFALAVHLLVLVIRS